MATVTDRLDRDGAPGVGEGTRPRARWARLSSFGLILAGLGPLLMLTAGISWGLDVGAEVPYFGMTAGFAFVGAALVRARGTWRKVVGLVAGLLAAFLMFWTAFGLFNPASVFDFVPGLLVVPGVLLGIGAGIAAIRAQRRDDLVAAPGDGERNAVRGIALGVGALVVVSLVLTAAGRDTVADDAEVDFVVQLSDFEFDQERYEAAGGTRILVKNDDPFAHTFTVDALDIDVSLNPGSEKLVTIPVSVEPGEFVLYCEPHTGSPEDPGDDDMASVLDVS